jgi:micrococcal nuclease
MLHLIFLASAALALAAPRAGAPQAPATATAPAPVSAAPRISWVDVARVVDGDTIHVTRDGQLEKLRLLCVDTEEKIGSGAGSPTKPQTVFGEETALWAQETIAKLAQGDAAPRVGLAFPPGREDARDPFGRLLCHVILPDGTDFNVLLVQLGKSPYFTKYGYSEMAHDEFVAAQAQARAQKIGIWDPATNAPRTPGAPSAARPYDRLLPWWNLRADAVRVYEAARRANPAEVAHAESAASLAAAAARNAPVRVFGEVQRVFDEDDGTQTVLFRSASKEDALRVRIRKDDVAAHAALELARRPEEFRQNYVWFRGTISRDARGYRATSAGPASWSDGAQAGP